MLILEPIAHETIWGGAQLLPYVDTDATKIGHLYSVFDVDGVSNRIVNGRFAGQTLKRWFSEHKAYYRLECYEEFPLVIALTEANDNLSLQVHPDDMAARKLENRRFGKNESWYFLQSPGYIHNGCKCSNLEDLQEALSTGDADLFAEKLAVNQGDYVFVEAGTLHALSAGSLVYEIEENCQLTYRVSDFGRVDARGNARELHIDKALQSIKLGLQSRTESYDEPKEERLYTTVLLHNVSSYRNASNTVECVTFLADETFVGDNRFKKGASVILEPSDELSGSIEAAIVARPKTLKEAR